MLNLEDARRVYFDNPEDPYVVLPGHNIEVRFSDDGMITAAYNADEAPAIRWHSQEFHEYLERQKPGGLRTVRELQQEDAPIKAQEQLARPRKAQRVRLRAADAFRPAQRRGED
jgi:hypothetical protein